MNILLIDDHALFSKSLEIALEDYPEIDHFYSLLDYVIGHNSSSP
nr:hypothetical protein [Bacillus sp. 123MFChir2]